MHLCELKPCSCFLRCLPPHLQAKSEVELLTLEAAMLQVRDGICCWMWEYSSEGGGGESVAAGGGGILLLEVGEEICHWRQLCLLQVRDGICF